MQTRRQALVNFLRGFAATVTAPLALGQESTAIRPQLGLLWDLPLNPNVVVGGRGGHHRPFELLLPAQARVTAVYVTCHDRYFNVTKAILRLRVNRSVVLEPDWQDVKMAGSTLMFLSATSDGVPASSLQFVSHHIGHIKGDDETVIQHVAVYGWI